MDLAWLWQARDEIWRLARQQMLVAGLATAIAVCAAVPLGLLVRRAARSADALLQVVGTIPVLALLVLAPLATGRPVTDRWTVVAALSVVALVVVLRGVLRGLDRVESDTVRSARALGLTGLRRLLRLDLPLAAPAILSAAGAAWAGTIGLVTLAALVEAGALGGWFVSGLRDHALEPVATALLASVLLAGIAALLVGLVRHLVGRWEARA